MISVAIKIPSTLATSNDSFVQTILENADKLSCDVNELADLINRGWLNPYTGCYTTRIPPYGDMMVSMNWCDFLNDVKKISESTYWQIRSERRKLWFQICEGKRGVDLND